MGYWATDAEGHSFATDAKGEKLLWGDAPADEIDSTLDSLYSLLGRQPQVGELVDLFEQAVSGGSENEAVLYLQIGLRNASSIFAHDLDRAPLPAELRAGFLFALGGLQADKEMHPESEAATQEEAAMLKDVDELGGRA